MFNSELNKPIIIVEELTKIYKMDSFELKALQNVSFKVYSGEFVSVMGPSGSGKSTLMNLLGCRDNPTSGRYLLDQQDVSKLKDNTLATFRNKKIGFVFRASIYFQNWMHFKMWNYLWFMQVYRELNDMK